MTARVPRAGGFALVAALWLLVALSAVGLDAALRAQERRRAAANVLDRARARAAALAGAEYARSRLTAAMVGLGQELRQEAIQNARGRRSRRRAAEASMDRIFRWADPLEDPWRDPQQLMTQEMAFGEARYTLIARDVGSALNLNEASEEMLRQFFAQGLQVDFTLADELTQAILDWRDRDDIARVNGGERTAYLEARRAVLPANRDFADLSELRHVMGMTPEIFAAARPHLTLVGSGDINVNAAPEPVLLAAPGMTVAGVQEILRRRESGVFPRNDDQLERMLPGGAEEVFDRNERSFDRATIFSTEEVEILVEGWVDGSPVRVRAQLVVRRSSTESVVTWRDVG